MDAEIKHIIYCPVKSLSSQNLKSCSIKKNQGMLNDRIFAFSRGIDFEKAKLIEKKPEQRKLNNFLTLKNSPVLNKYNFIYNDNKLTLTKNNEELISISPDNIDEHSLLSNKLLELESSLIKPINFLKNNNYPFYDTSHSNNIFNSISLINLNSIKDFEKKIKHKINHERFRGNIYINNIKPWIEFDWINKKITINDCSFLVLKKIPRCSATNLRLNSDIFDINVPQKLREVYGHIDMGIYLKPLNNGIININDTIKLK